MGVAIVQLTIRCSSTRAKTRTKSSSSNLGGALGEGGAFPDDIDVLFVGSAPRRTFTEIAAQAGERLNLPLNMSRSGMRCALVAGLIARTPRY